MGLTIDQVRKMTAEEIAERWDEVAEALAQPPPRPDPVPPGELTVAHLRWMTAEEINDRWGEVSALLADLKEEQNGGNDD